MLKKNTMWTSGVYIKEVSPAQASMGPLPQSPADAPAPQSPEPDQGTSTALWMNSPQTEAKEDPMPHNTRGDLDLLVTRGPPSWDPHPCRQRCRCTVQGSSAAPRCPGVRAKAPGGSSWALSEGLLCPCPPLPHNAATQCPTSGLGTCCPHSWKSLPQVTGPSGFHPMSLLRKALPDDQAKVAGTHCPQGPAAIPGSLSCHSLCCCIPAGVEDA